MLTLDNLTTRIMGAVLAGHTTGSTIADTVNTDRLTCYRRLHQLRDHGLITWDKGHTGTIRPTVTILATLGGTT